MKSVKDKQLLMAADFAGYPLKEAIKEYLESIFNSSKVEVFPPRRADTTAAPTFIVLSNWRALL